MLQCFVALVLLEGDPGRSVSAQDGAGFGFYRTPHGDVEKEDFQNMLDGYAFKKLQ